jgi:1-acyl-sn-glycerol-3-phosphate acyltransferase
VFVFNHQSKLDPILIMKLLRGGFTGVAKKEAGTGGCRKLGSAVTWAFAGRCT